MDIHLLISACLALAAIAQMGLIIKKCRAGALPEKRPALTQFENDQQLTQILEHSPLTIVVTNPQGDIEYANPFFTRLTGYTFQEAKGKNTRILNSGTHPKEYYSALWKTISSGKEWHGEFQNKKKNGDLYWESASISSIKNAQGEVTHYICIKEDITPQKMNEVALAKLREELHNLSLSDPLTGLANRRGLETLAGAALKIAKRARQSTAVFFIDIDNMKEINDRYGHKEGDQALVAMAELLKTCFRDSDIIARLGGDEFVVFMPAMEQASSEKVIARFETMVNMRNQNIAHQAPLQWSLGAAYDTPQRSLTLQELIEEADKKMYVHKTSKKHS